MRLYKSKIHEKLTCKEAIEEIRTRSYATEDLLREYACEKKKYKTTHRQFILLILILQMYVNAPLDDSHDDCILLGLLIDLKSRLRENCVFAKYFTQEMCALNDQTLVISMLDLIHDRFATKQWQGHEVALLPLLKYLFEIQSKMNIPTKDTYQRFWVTKGTFDVRHLILVPQLLSLEAKLTILQKHYDNIRRQGRWQLNIDRTLPILPQVLECIQRLDDASTCCQMLDITFNSEYATDLGGPQREFLFLLAKELFGSYLWHKESYSGLLWMPRFCSQGQWYWFGMMFAMLFVNNQFESVFEFIPTSILIKIIQQRSINENDFARAFPKLFEMLYLTSSSDDFDSELLITAAQFHVAPQTCYWWRFLGAPYVEIAETSHFEARKIQNPFANYNVVQFLLGCSKQIGSVINIFTMEDGKCQSSVVSFGEIRDRLVFEESCEEKFKERIVNVLQQLDYSELVDWLLFVSADHCILRKLRTRQLNITIKQQHFQNDTHLPQAHTCMYTFALPIYSSDEMMKSQLRKCLQFKESFGLT